MKSDQYAYEYRVCVVRNAPMMERMIENVCVVFMLRNQDFEVTKVWCSYRGSTFVNV